MKWHLRYWWARLKNDFLQLTLRQPNEAQAVEEIMSDLKRDPTLRSLLEEKEVKITDEERS